MLRISVCIGLYAIASRFTNLPTALLLAVTAVIYALTGGWRWLRIAPKILLRDINMVKAGLFAGLRFVWYLKMNWTFSDIFTENVRKHPDKYAFVSADDGSSLTFREAEKLSHKIANIFHDAGYRRGDVVVLLMENRVEYIPIWLGLTRIGVVTSLVNYNLRGESLKHCVKVCKCKAIIFSKEMASPLREITDDLKVELYSYDQCDAVMDDAIELGELVSSAPSLPPPERVEKVTLKDEIILYMYTSGTTGLPKAAPIRSAKCIFFCFLCKYSLGINSNDVIYNALPLYHGNGGLIMATQVMVNGATMVVKKRFSASRYMNDCRKHDVTIINYIGETCRYLLSQPSDVNDIRNSIRIALGNGLRASIWDEFKLKYDIDLICEIYGSTEGNIGLMNFVGQRGAVGFNPVFFPNLIPVKLVKVDKDTGDIIRGTNGLAVEATTNEPGQVVGKIRNDNVFHFDGYHDESETRKKIARDVFKMGDSVFLSGDILTKDEEGYYYFHDRTGDTFRWKGENVSTNEVEGLMSKALQLTDVCVYATPVPGCEGKAGMACICDPHRTVNVDELQQTLSHLLPHYARPIFLRMTSSLEVTGTYKFQKNRLRNQGYDPHTCAQDGDQLFYFDVEQKKYLVLDAHAYERIMTQQIRF